MTSKRKPWRSRSSARRKARESCWPTVAWRNSVPTRRKPATATTWDGRAYSSPRTTNTYRTERSSRAHATTQSAAGGFRQHERSFSTEPPCSIGPRPGGRGALLHGIPGRDEAVLCRYRSTPVWISVNAHETRKRVHIQETLLASMMELTLSSRNGGPFRGLFLPARSDILGGKIGADARSHLANR